LQQVNRRNRTVKRRSTNLQAWKDFK
jgi:hypothetical protein